MQNWRKPEHCLGTMTQWRPSFRSQPRATRPSMLRNRRRRASCPAPRARGSTPWAAGQGRGAWRSSASRAQQVDPAQLHRRPGTDRRRHDPGRQKPIKRLDGDAMARLRHSHFGFVFPGSHIPCPPGTCCQNVALAAGCSASRRPGRAAPEMLSRVGLGAARLDPAAATVGVSCSAWRSRARWYIGLTTCCWRTGHRQPRPGASERGTRPAARRIRDSRAAGVMVTHRSRSGGDARRPRAGTSSRRAA